MLDLIEGNIKLKQEKMEKLDVNIEICADSKNFEILALNKVKPDNTDKIMDILKDFKFMMIEGVMK